MRVGDRSSPAAQTQRWSSSHQWWGTLLMCTGGDEASQPMV